MFPSCQDLRQVPSFSLHLSKQKLSPAYQLSAHVYLLAIVDQKYFYFFLGVSSENAIYSVDIAKAVAAASDPTLAGGHSCHGVLDARNDYPSSSGLSPQPTGAAL